MQFKKCICSKKKGVEPFPIPVIETQYKIIDLNKGLDEVFQFTFQVKYFWGYINKYEKEINPNEKKDIDKCRYCNKNNINQDIDDGENS